jgi:hypothetical protein
MQIAFILLSLLFPIVNNQLIFFLHFPIKLFKKNTKNHTSNYHILLFLISVNIFFYLHFRTEGLIFLLKKLNNFDKIK